MITYDFVTAEFEDDDASRAERINENIGGAALATWLSQQLSAADYDASATFAEDHGWDFSIKTSNGTYACACSIDDDQGNDRVGFVTIARGKSRLLDNDPIALAIRNILTGHPGISQVTTVKR
jgi:predicted secreted hydrolase